MKRYQQIFWDLDGTIFDFKRCEIEALEDTFLVHAIPFNKVTLNKYMEINDALWKLHEKGLISQEKLLILRFELLLEEMDIVALPVEISKLYQENLMKKSYFMEDALEVIKQLYRDYDLYIMTNGKNRTQSQRIKHAKIEEYFKDIFISEEVGFNKPHKEYFDECFKRIGLKDRSTAVIIGDSLSSDILGGMNAGISTCWYNPWDMKLKNGIKCDFEIKQLKELLMLF